MLFYANPFVEIAKAENSDQLCYLVDKVCKLGGKVSDLSQFGLKTNSLIASRVLSLEHRMVNMLYTVYIC